MGQVIHLDDAENNPQEWEEMLDDLLNVDHGLSPRAVDFIEDLDKNWRGRELTDKQLDWLKALHNERC